MSFRSAAIAGIVALLLAGVSLVPIQTTLEIDRSRLAADGRSTLRARAIARSWAGIAVLTPAIAPRLEAGDLDLTALLDHDRTLVVRAGHRGGRAAIVLGNERIPIEVVLDPADADRDGIPDSAEILSETDRAAFTAWFTAIAEAQATHIDDAWPAIHQDCAGLVRFAFREALRRHDRAWLEHRRFLPSFDAPDVAAVRYPDLPFLGDRPFRAVAGAFDPLQPIELAFTAAPSARTLWQLNTVLIGRDLAEARPGDLLFFSVPDAAGSRMHTMIVLGPRPGSTDRDPPARVVYHTGYDDHRGLRTGRPACRRDRTSEAGHALGEVRLVSLEALSAHPDPSWHPLRHNARFLGVHRLVHLDHSAQILAGGVPR